MVPVWVVLLALLVVFAENAIRSVRQDRRAAAESWELGQKLNEEFQRVHEILDQVRDVPGVRKESAVRQAHAELTKLHRMVVGSEPPK